MTSATSVFTKFQPIDGHVTYEPEMYEKVMKLELPHDLFVAVGDHRQGTGYAVQEIKLRWVWYADEIGPSFEVELKGVALTQKGQPDKRASFRTYVYPSTTAEVQRIMNLFPDVAQLEVHGLTPKPELRFTHQQVLDKLISGVERRTQREGV